MSSIKLHSSLSSSPFNFENDADEPFESSSPDSPCSVYLDTNNSRYVKLFKYLPVRRKRERVGERRLWCKLLGDVIYFIYRFRRRPTSSARRSVIITEKQKPHVINIDTDCVRYRPITTAAASELCAPPLVLAASVRSPAMSCGGDDDVPIPTSCKVFTTYNHVVWR
ncbi:hypothetical protein QTP88_007446 [Uroleucon formosanum]